MGSTRRARRSDTDSRLVTTPASSPLARRLVPAALLTLLVCLPAAPAQASDEEWVTRTKHGLAASAGAEPPLRVRITSTKQSTILRSRRIKVFVETTQPQIVRFRSRARGNTRAERQPLTRERTARFINRRTGAVALRLTPEGRERLSGCGRLRIIVTGVGRPVSEEQTLVFAKSRSYREIRNDPRRCGG